MGEVQPSAATNGRPATGPWRLVTRTLAQGLGRQHLLRGRRGGVLADAVAAAAAAGPARQPGLRRRAGSGRTSSPRCTTGSSRFCRTVFSPNAVHDIIEPTVNSILTVGKGEIVSVGFLISLWAGSSAMASFVDAITVALRPVRRPQRRLAADLRAAAVPVRPGARWSSGCRCWRSGPDLLPEFFPADVAPDRARRDRARSTTRCSACCWSLALTTLYKLALPRKLPWHRGAARRGAGDGRVPALQRSACGST